MKKEKKNKRTLSEIEEAELKTKTIKQMAAARSARRAAALHLMPER